MSSTEAAVALGVCERTLRRYIESGAIRYRRLPGGHYRIPEEAIAEFWAQTDCAKQARRQARSPSTPPRVAARAAPGKRRPALAVVQEEYDLSQAHLAEIRAQFAGTRAR